jgi:hypothetical protein
VPYGEPTWLTPEFKSPYYKDSHRALQKGEWVVGVDVDAGHQFAVALTVRVP